jgi:hypothetical protein
MRGRRERGLADPHADPRERQLREALRKTRNSGHPAPAREPDRDHRTAHPEIGESRDRDAERGIEDRERGPAQEADPRVGDAE